MVVRTALYELSKRIIVIECTQLQFDWINREGGDACVSADISHRIEDAIQVDGHSETVKLFDEGFYHYWYEDMFATPASVDIAEWFFGILRELIEWETILFCVGTDNADD